MRSEHPYAVGMAVENCPECRGTGWKMVPREDGSGKIAVACECGAGERAARVMERIRIPKLYQHCDFENYITDLADDSGNPASRRDSSAYTPQAIRSLMQAKMLAQTFVRDYPGGPDAGLLLTGSSGTGKTHLAVAALKELALRGHACLFCEYGKLLRQVQSTYRADSEVSDMSILDPILSVEVLVMDDLGCIKPSAWVLETIGYILNTRYAEASADLRYRRCTIITTNYLDEPREKKEPVKDPSGRFIFVREDTLADRIGARMRSRLYEMCRTVEVFAPDFRREVRTASRGRA